MGTAFINKPDITVRDAEDEPVMLVEVKAQKAIDEGARRRLTACLQAMGSRVPYAMLVDKQTIQIFQWDGQELRGPIFEVPTETALSFYDPEFASKKIYEDYFVILVEGWLRDVAYHWKSEVPPHYEQLEQIGLAQRIHEGTTTTDASAA